MTTDTWTRSELTAMRAAQREAAKYENMYGDFLTYIDCEDVVRDALHDILDQEYDLCLVDGDIFWEMVTHTASVHYGGEKVGA